MQLPMLYTNPDILQNVLGYYTPWITKYPLWIAHYGVTVPRPGPLYNTYRFWQYTDRGPGLDYGAESKQIDLDYFNGTINDLMIFSQRDITLTQEERLNRIEQFLKEQLNYIIPE
jgi:GH25 family lysozyme M1 (1,4-beta-N-acetylmuramidase)